MIFHSFYIQFSQQTIRPASEPKNREMINLSDEEDGTFTEETGNIVATYNKYGEIEELRLKGETYSADGPCIYIQITNLEGIHLNEIPDDVGIYPVEKVVQNEFGKEIKTLDFPIPLIDDVTIFNNHAYIRMHGYTKYWYGILGLSYYMDLLIESLRRLEKENSEIAIEDFENQEDVHFFLTFSVGLNSSLSIHEALDKIREIFNLLNSSLEEVVNSLHVFVEKRNVDFERKIREKWDEALTIKDSNEKGKALEELLVLIFSTLDGFIPSHRIRTETEEIDISVRNESEDSFWSKFTPFILIECKNWSTKCGKDEFVIFQNKLTNRFGLSRLGFLVSLNGFCDTITKELLRGSKSEFLIVPVDGNGLKELIESKERSELLKSFVSKSAFT